MSEEGHDRIQRDLQTAARVRGLDRDLDRVERRLARLSAALDGASVTLVRDAERFRPPAGPDPARRLQRIVGTRTAGPADDDR